MRKSMIIGLCLGLSGCLYQTASTSDILKAEKFCGGTRNIQNIVIVFSGNENVECIDGTIEFLGNIKL